MQTILAILLELLGKDIVSNQLPAQLEGLGDHLPMTQRACLRKTPPLVSDPMEREAETQAEEGEGTRLMDTLMRMRPVRDMILDATVRASGSSFN